MGATGDGDTDDTAAIQTAVDDLNTTSASRSATLVFPAGTYKITKPIDFALGANTKITGTYVSNSSGVVTVTTSSNHNFDNRKSSYDVVYWGLLVKLLQ